ncbi:hypothetical protein ABZ569_27120 [Streptomyces albus]|uniref:hypothetical protein n=1 Tax=Streptomyces albus TaxID=1888 RepID=UPI0033F55472
MGEGRPGLGLEHRPTLSQGDRLDEAARALDGMRKGLGGAPFAGLAGLALNPFADAAFGEYGGQQAFTSFARAWDEEIEVLAGALRQIRGKIGDGVALNTHTDHGVRSALHAIGRPAEHRR